MAAPHGWNVGVAKAGQKTSRLSGGKTYLVWWWLLRQGLESGNLAVWQFQADISVEALLLWC